MLIDRRLNGKNKSVVNRQRFIRRYKEQIKKSVSESIGKRSITDINKGEKVNIPAKDINEPVLSHGAGGKRERIFPGNKEFVTGDTIERPPSGQGQGGGGKASDSGEGVDEFIFQLSREEFLNFFFDDLELPDLIKTELCKIVDYKSVRAGYTSDGVPTNISIVRSLKNALARRIALQSPYKQELASTEEALEKLDESNNTGRYEYKELVEKKTLLEKKIKAVPFIDTFDLRYNNRVRQPKPVTQAVMFCIMDISGSMNEKRKRISKQFFSLLYLFLTRTYDDIELVFIRHHTTAKEVDEEEFFYSRETGGTVVSSALDLTSEIILDRYPSNNWNIYVAQASDGDNWQGDSQICKNILETRILPSTQYYAYVEVNVEAHQELWQEYEKVKKSHSNFAMQSIFSASDIYPVFRELFQKRLA